MRMQCRDRMLMLQRVFFILLVFDFIGLFYAGISLIPTFKTLIGYGMVMLFVTGLITAVTIAVMLIEILAKRTLIRSTDPAFSWASGRKSCVKAARLLVLLNLLAVVFSLLSAGGEGATLLNQLYLYLSMLASVVEVIAAVVYLRTVKKDIPNTKEDR